MHLVKGPLSLLGQLQQTCCGTPEAAFERSIQGTLIPPPGGSRGQTSQALKAETLLSAPTAGRQDTPVPGPWETGWSLPLSWPVSFSGAGHQGSREGQERSLVCTKMEGRKAKVIKRKKKEGRKRQRKRGRQQKGEGKGLGGQ